MSQARPAARARLLPALLAASAWGLALPACGGDTEEPRKKVVDFHGLVNGSPEALALLIMIDNAPLEKLQIDVGLPAAEAAGIIAHRDGPDGQRGTADDNQIGSLLELADIAAVTSATFAALARYPQPPALALGACDAGATVHGVAEASDTAAAILRMVHSAPLATFVDGASLPALTGRSLVTYRDGPDDADGTTDDRVLECLAQLARLPNVDGAVVIPALAAFIATHGNGWTCALPALLNVANATVSGTTVGAGHDTELTCSSGTGPDLAYVFTLGQPMHVQLTTTGFDTVIELRRSCDSSASAIACADEGGPAYGASRVEADLQPGTYYLIVSGYGGAEGAFELTMALSCAAGYLYDPLSQQCYDNPCLPNPCSAPKGRCVLSSGFPPTYSCACAPGYIDDGAGGCMIDPDGNDWTFMVFLNADNNLEEFGYEDLDEMEVAGSTANVHIVVLMDSYERDGGAGRKLYVNQGSSEVLENLGEIDMGSWQTLADFGVWAVETYPSTHYALVLWNHGGGWKSQRRPPAVLKEFSNDDHGSGDGISIANGDYARALEQITAAAGRKLDLVGFDACLMGLWEVADVTSGYANVLVASEETEPGAGWPYEDILVPLIENPDMLPIELGNLIVNAYYNEDSTNSTLASSDLTTAEALATAIDGLATAMRTNSAHFDTYAKARSHAQRYEYAEHRDLRGFAAEIAAGTSLPAAVTAAAQALVDQLDETITNSKAQSDYNDSSGLAVYLPSNCTVETSYYNSAGATWARTAWDEFLVEFTPATTQCNCRTDSECGPGMHCVDDWSTDVPFCEHD